MPTQDFKSALKVVFGVVVGIMVLFILCLGIDATNADHLYLLDKGISIK